MQTTVDYIETVLRQDPRDAKDRWPAEKLTAHGNDLLISFESLRIAHTMEILEGKVSPCRILEVGAGNLDLAKVVRRYFPSAQLIAVEHPQRQHLWTSVYRTVLTTERIWVAATDLVGTGLPFRSACFDLAFFSEVVEHLPPNTVPAALTEIARVLQPGGALVLTTPNLARWRNRENLLRGDTPGQHSPAICIDGTYPHLRLYTMNELADLLSGAGFLVEHKSFFDNVVLGESCTRRILTAILTPIRTVWPALRDTLLILAVRR